MDNGYSSQYRMEVATLFMLYHKQNGIEGLDKAASSFVRNYRLDVIRVWQRHAWTMATCKGLTVLIRFVIEQGRILPSLSLSRLKAYSDNVLRSSLLGL